jgi:hypothetical protein
MSVESRTVSSRTTSHIEFFHYALKSLPLGHTLDVDKLCVGKNARVELLPDLKLLNIIET